MMRLIPSIVVLVALAMPAYAADPILLHAAGSLTGALTEIAALFKQKTGRSVQARFGPSGVLREAIGSGEPAEVFASANMEHPAALQRAGKSGPVVLFARNRLCVLARPGVTVTADTVIDRLLDPAIKLGTSTPGADPSGDYAWEVFRKIDRLRPGALAVLDRKALKLMGGPASPPPPKGQSLYSYLLGTGAADLLLTYCTGARAAVAEMTGATMAELPAELSVGADYGLTVMRTASPGADQFSLFILSVEAQAVLQTYGFAAPNAP